MTHLRTLPRLWMPASPYKTTQCANNQTRKNASFVPPRPHPSRDTHTVSAGSTDNIQHEKVFAKDSYKDGTSTNRHREARTWTCMHRNTN